MLQGLARHGVKVPEVIGWEDDASIIGGSFLVMARVNGVPLPQHPSYHVAGLLQELTEEQRQASWADAITTIASINRIERSEEHTSELQSLMRISYSVFCLKKKNTKQTYI